MLIEMSLKFFISRYFQKILRPKIWNRTFRNFMMNKIVYFIYFIYNVIKYFNSENYFLLFLSFSSLLNQYNSYPNDLKYFLVLTSIIINYALNTRNNGDAVISCKVFYSKFLFTLMHGKYTENYGYSKYFFIWV